VHTIGTKVFGTAVLTDATDYRYAQRVKESTIELNEFSVSDELANRCIGLSKALGLEFAGIDLKITPKNVVYCFEVNPSPAFSYYEANTGQPIARALAERLGHKF